MESLYPNRLRKQPQCTVLYVDGHRDNVHDRCPPDSRLANKQDALGRQAGDHGIQYLLQPRCNVVIAKWVVPRCGGKGSFCAHVRDCLLDTRNGPSENRTCGMVELLRRTPTPCALLRRLGALGLNEVVTLVDIIF